MKWTPEQARAIELRDKNILVAAAAGSGKTAVLVERIKRLILEDKCPIDRMLIVTFTNAAASEMKEKIRRAIGQTVDELAEKAEAGDAQAAEDLNFLKEQLNLLPQAQISTFHAFALEIIRKYFYVIDVEPNFKICDDAQQVILRAEAMDALLEEQFEEGGEEFLRFLDCYSGDRNENRFREMIDHAYDTIQALPEPLLWLRDKVEMLSGLRGDEERDLDFEQVMDVLWNMADQNLKAAEAAINTNLRRAREAKLSDAEKLAEDDLAQIAKIREAFGDYDALRDALGAFKLGTLRKTLYNPPKESSMTSEEAEAMKNAASAGRDLAKKKVKELREEYFAQSAEAMTDEMAQTYADAALIEKLLIRYGMLYSQEKQKRGLVDFSDIEHFAWRILKDEEASQYYQEKFIHIFVDEYQDSNVMQEAFLKRICRENNLFLVGDVKQSIYKFRLAEPEIFQHRYWSYSQEKNTLSEKIDLNRNFRSKRPIIDFVNEVFDFVMEDYDETAALHMGDPFGDHYYDEPTLYLTETPWSEDEEIDDELKNMIKAEKEALAAARIILESLGQPIYDSKAQTMRGLELSDIVILMRGVRGYGDIFYNVLMENDIAAYVDDNDGYFDTMEVNTFLSLLQILDNEKQDVPLLTVLRSEIFGFTVEELAAVRIACREGTYHEAFAKYAKEGTDSGLRTKCAAAASSLEEWQALSIFMPLEELVWKLLLDTGFYLSMGAHPGGQQRQANLRALVDKALTYRKSQSGSLYGFIRYIEAVKEKKVASGQVKLVGEGDNLVRIMTIHKSKGLEFPMVILTGFCRRLNYTAAGSRGLLIHKDLGLGLPIINRDEKWYRTTMLQNIIKAKFRQEEAEEEKRVLYVALTRPKDRLAILGICDDVQEALEKVGSEPPKDASYFQMTGNRICTRLQRYTVMEEGKLLSLASGRKKSNRHVLKLFEEPGGAEDCQLQQQVRQQMEFSYPGQRELQIHSKYSVSELNAAVNQRQPVESLDEPASFKRKDVFSAAQRGTIYHTLLEHLSFHSAWAMGDYEQGLGEVEETKNWLVENLFLTAEEAAVIDSEIIMKLMKSPLGQRLAEAEAENRIWKERPFNLKMNHDPDGSGETAEVLVQGVIDCWFEEEDGLVLVDYKTGHSRNMAEKYRTQIDIYRRALEVTTGRCVKEAYIYLTNSGELVAL